MRHRPRPARSLLTALAALTALTTTACGNTDEADDEAPATPRDRPTTSRPAPQPSSSPAADGSDAGACADGNCEIAVTEPVTIRFPAPGDAGRATLSVTKVGPNEIEYAVTSGDNRSEGGASGPGQGCLTYLREGGSGNSCGALDPTRPSPQPGAVVIQATTGTDGTALLHIVSSSP
ncbi:Secreted protein OS=Streptomyces tendae OX=1932 GN=GUR47_15660 PE=4 SV=1 [Streptomyces tendae]